MSAGASSFAVTMFCITLASGACAPDTDAAPGSFPSTGAPQLNAAAGASTVGLAGRGAAGSSPLAVPSAISSGAAGTGLVTTTPGVAGRGPLAGTPGVGGRGALAGVGGQNLGVGGMGAVTTVLVAGAGMPLPAAGANASAGATATGMGGPCGSGMPSDGRPTSGPLACIVEQHNAVRAKVMASTPLPPVTWNADIARYAQEWTDMTCMAPQHRSNPSLNGQRLGENLFASFGLGPMMPGKQAVDGWGGEVACYTYGKFLSGDKCDMMCTSAMHSDGCGHYTQIVWRASTQIGCGVTTCGSGFSTQTAVVCNYAPAGNFVGTLPY